MGREIQSAISDAIVNFRFGACDQGFEQRPANAQGTDETPTLVENDDGSWSIKSPDGTQWLSIQPNGDWEARDASREPGAWEKFSREGNVLTEFPKERITRAPVKLAGGAL